MSERLFEGLQFRTGRLPLGRPLDFPVGHLAILLVVFGAKLVFQLVQVEGAQGLRTETAALEVFVLGDVRVGLEQIGNLGPDIAGYAINIERLEQKKRLEVGVGGDASIHPPILWGRGTSATGRRGREGSHGGGGGGRAGSRGTRGHGRAVAEMGARAGSGSGRWRPRACDGGCCSAADGLRRRAPERRPISAPRAWRRHVQAATRGPWKPGRAPPTRTLHASLHHIPRGGRGACAEEHLTEQRAGLSFMCCWARGRSNRG